MKKFFEVIKKKWIADTTRLVLLVAIIILVYILINVLVGQANMPTFDFTEEKIYSVSDESKELIKDIDQEVTLYFFGADEDTSIIDFAKQYTVINPNIKVEVVNYEERPDLYQKYNVSSAEQAIAVQSPERDTVLSIYELATYDYTTGETVDLKEEKITNAIIETTVAEKPKVYLLKGHEEITDLMTVATEYIENDVIDIEELDLLTTDMPDDCECLIITNPSKDFTEGETNKIIDYINDGGNILWLNNAQTEKLPNVQKILDLYGVKIGNGVVRETDSNKMLPGAASFILPSLSTHKITEDIVDGYVILFNPTKLEFADDEEMEELGVTATPIIQSSETSYYRTDIENESSEKQDDEEEGPFVIAEELTKKVGDKESTLMVFGDGLFVSDTQIAMRVSSSASQKYNAINFRSNSDMLLNTINYLVERESFPKKKKNMEYVTYTATEQEDLTIRAIIFFIPLIIIIIGIIIWQRRRRRR